MRSRPASYVLLSVLGLCALAVLVGCGGGGGGGGVTGTAPGPEDTVAALLTSWRAGSSGPALPLAQTTGSTTGQQITFHDLYGTAWTFEIVSINRPSSNYAEVVVKLAAIHGYDLLRMTFYLAFSEGRWQLDDIEVPEEFLTSPIIAVSGDRVWGYVKDSTNSRPLQGATVWLYPEGVTDPAQARSTTTDANGMFVFNTVAPGNYQLVIGGAGYEQKTIPVTVTATTTSTSTSTSTGTSTGTTTGTAPSLH